MDFYSALPRPNPPLCKRKKYIKRFIIKILTGIKKIKT